MFKRSDPAAENDEVPGAASRSDFEALTHSPEGVVASLAPTLREGGPRSPAAALSPDLTVSPSRGEHDTAE